MTIFRDADDGHVNVGQKCLPFFVRHRERHSGPPGQQACAANAIYLELRYLISLFCISRLPRLASSDDRCVSTRLPYSGPPVSRVLQHCAARYHREALP